MKIVFFGTPKFAAFILESLYKNKNIYIDSVISQPDKPVGRKKIITSPIVKTLASELGLNVYQPENKEKLYKILSEKEVDFFVVVAYGMIFTKKMLEIPKYGCINIHASLLPKYRGASPIQSALINGDKETGISIIEMNEKMDEGPVYLSKRVEISENDNLETLSNKLAVLSTKILPDVLKDIRNNGLSPIPQNTTEISYCNKITKKDGHIDWEQKTTRINNQIKAYFGWPTTYTNFDNKIIHIHEAKMDLKKCNLKPGTFYIENNTLKISTKDGNILPISLQISGKNIMTTKDFINGYKNKLSTR